MAVRVREVSLQVGAVDATDSPRDVPNATKTKERAAATRATGDDRGPMDEMSAGFDRYSRWGLDRLHCRIPSRSAQTEERQNEQDHDDQSDQIDQAAHVSRSAFSNFARSTARGEECSQTQR